MQNQHLDAIPLQHLTTNKLQSLVVSDHCRKSRHTLALTIYSVSIAQVVGAQSLRFEECCLVCIKNVCKYIVYFLTWITWVCTVKYSYWSNGALLSNYLYIIFLFLQFGNFLFPILFLFVIWSKHYTGNSIKVVFFQKYKLWTMSAQRMMHFCLFIGPDSKRITFVASKFAVVSF